MTATRSKILVVDDEKDNLTVLRGQLEGEGFSVVTAASAREGMLAVIDSRPDLVLCDVSMPDDTGVHLCQKLKKDARSKTIPVILMSGVHKGTLDQIEGIEFGAEDYLAKPISPGLLVTKVRAVLRRCSAPPASEKIKLDGLEVDLDGRVVKRKGQALPLTRKEFDLFTTFLRRPGQVLSVPYLIETVWGYDPADYNDPHTVGVHISSLRKKLGPKTAKQIVSVPALGYRFDA